MIFLYILLGIIALIAFILSVSAEQAGIEQLTRDIERDLQKGG